MTPYIKKPIPLEARQVTLANAEEIAAWCGGEFVRGAPGSLHHVIVPSLDGEGSRRALMGDWVIEGTRGEFWRVEETIFAETYTRAPGPVTAPDESQLAHCRDCGHRYGAGCGCGCCTWATAAMDLATDALHLAGCGDPACHYARHAMADMSADRQVAQIVFEAVLPVIRAAATAAERERCAQLAERVNAGYQRHESELLRSYEPFAALLRGTDG